MKISYLLFTTLVLATPALAAPSSDALALKRIRATLEGLGGQIRDVDTRASLVLTPPAGSQDAQKARKFTMQVRFWLKMPDRMKFEVLNASLPLFNRWRFVQKGNQMTAYDPVGNREVTTDFKRLTGREPTRLDTSLGILGLLYDPSQNTYRLMGRAVRDGVPVYRVRMLLKNPQLINAYTKIAYTDIYVSTKDYRPLYSESYTTGGSLATTTTFHDFKRASRGWAPSRIVISDVRGERLFRKVQRKAEKHGVKPGAKPLKKRQIFRPTITMWVDWHNGVLFPSRIRGRSPDGDTSEWTLTQTRVNTGLPDSAFRL